MVLGVVVESRRKVAGLEQKLVSKRLWCAAVAANGATVVDQQPEPRFSAGPREEEQIPRLHAQATGGAQGQAREYDRGGERAAGEGVHREDRAGSPLGMGAMLTGLSLRTIATYDR
jgi:hypothetical protein